MALDPRYITILADATKFYYNDSELMELCTAFEVDLSYHILSGVPHLAWVRSLTQNIDSGNNRRFFRSLVASLISRALEGASHTDYDKQRYHKTMVDLLRDLEAELGKGGLPDELSVPGKNPSTAKSESRAFLGKAESEVILVDNMLGTETLECLYDVKQRIRILTGASSNSLARDFEDSLRDFKDGGHLIEIRRHPKLHDRYLLFNKRCWLSASSLKDIGSKGFNIIEVIDGKVAIYADVARKWEESIPLRFIPKEN